MNIIRSFELEYNLYSFFRDLPQIRENTFREDMIKHMFRDAGIWPVSFKAVEMKLQEYRKKKRREIEL